MRKVNIPIISQELVNLNSFDVNKASLNKNGGYYCTYRTLLTAEKILGYSDQQGCFFVSCIEDMNDPDETNLHNGDADRVFALCFSNCRSESIPMWYLYGGITGQGARIGFTADKMSKLINDISCVYPVSNHKIETDNPIYRDQFELTCGWIFYRNKDGRIKHINQHYKLKEPENCFESNFERENYYIKNYEWNYEKEFRIVFKFREKPGEQIAVMFDKNALSKGISVLLAPNVPNEISKVDLTKRLSISESKIKRSKLNSRLELLKRNAKSIAEQFDQVSENLSEEEKKKIHKRLESELVCLEG